MVFDLYICLKIWYQWGPVVVQYEANGLRKAKRNILHSYNIVSRIAARITVLISLLFTCARRS